MKALLFTFVPPSDTSKATGHTIAKFIADHLDVSLAWKADQLEECEIVMIMSGAAAYCDIREQLAEVMLKARRVVWIQDDYTARPTPIDSPAESPYRAVFRWRHEQGRAPVDYWTTCDANVWATEASSYVNWNALGYEPWLDVPEQRAETLIYYGGYRPKRRKAFAKYFWSPTVPTCISSKPGNDFTRLFPDCSHVPILGRKELIPALSAHGLGLYLADEPSLTAGHSPARRFYEMLSAGLPMVFDPATVKGLARYGIDAAPFAFVPGTLPEAMEVRDGLATAQARMWRQDYRNRVARQLRIAWSKL